MLALLAAACTNVTSALPPAALRIACVVVADIIVKSGSEWVAWKNDLQQIADAGLAQKSAAGAIVVREFGVAHPLAGECAQSILRLTLVRCTVQFEEVVGAIPHQLARSMAVWSPEEQQEALARFRHEGERVMFFARTVLSSMYVGAFVVALGTSVIASYYSSVDELTSRWCCEHAQTRRTQQRVTVY